MTTPHLTILTSLNARLWHTYAKAAVKSHLQHIAKANPGKIRYVVTVDGPVPTDLYGLLDEAQKEGHLDRFEILGLDNIPEFKSFLLRTNNVQAPGPVEGQPYEAWRWQFRRFWPKVYSLWHYSRAHDIGFAVRSDIPPPSPLLWLDADVVFHKDVDLTLILKDLVHGKNAALEVPYSIVCLDRGMPWNYMDSGYLLLHGPMASDFISKVFNVYEYGVIFEFREWHDAYLMSRVMEVMGEAWYKEHVYSLSGNEDVKDPKTYLNPMERTWLNSYCIHFKGARKGEANAN